MFYKDVSIGFASNLIPLILNGSKTLTYRIGSKYSFLTVGDEIMLKDSKTEKKFAKVKITERSLTTFKELPIDALGHEVYSSKDEQRKTFEKYYGKRINNSEKILILGFKMIQTT